MNTKQLRRSILSLAIRGRLVPQDPTDEPAIELLKRITPKATPITEKVPFPVPDGWCWCTLGDLISLLSGQDLEPNKYNDAGKGIPYMTGASNFNGGKLIINRWTEAPVTISKLGDLLITCKGTIGAMAFNDIGAMHIARQIMAISSSSVNLKYVQAFMMFNIASLEAQANSMIPGIARSTILKASFPLPPLAEQERIVKEVERWFACIEQLERSQEALGKAARQTKRTLLSLAISGRLVPQDPNDEPAIELLKRINPKFTPQPTEEPLPQGWTATTMSMLCELTDGEKIQGKEMINLDAKYLRGQNEGNTLKEGRLIPANSLLILVDGENSGEVFRAPIEGYQGSTFKRLVINDNMYEPFVLQVINSHRTKLRKNKVGAAIPHLDKKLFKDLTVLVPPLAEQERIVSKVEELFAVLDALQ